MTSKTASATSFLFLYLLVSACTMQADGGGDYPPGTPDGGSGSGSDGGNVGGDEPIPADDLGDVCTTYMDDGREMVSCLKKAQGYDFTGKQILFVGFCAAEGFSGYENGNPLPAIDKGDRVEFEMTGDVEDCEFTFGYWNGNTFVFAQYGRNVYAYDGHGAGFLRECGDRWKRVNGACTLQHDYCGMFVKRNPDHRPVPVGYYLPRNDCSP